MKNQLILLIGAATIAIILACQLRPITDLTIATGTSVKSTPATSATGTLLFETKFDNSTIIAGTDPQRPDITGSNLAGSAWSGTEFGDKFRLYYEEGSDLQRRAVITTDDGGSTNKIMKYILSDVNVASLNKARIQADLYGFNNTSTAQPYKEFYQSVRLKLHYSSFNKILQDPARLIEGSGDWLTLFEFWNNRNWGTTIAYPFRLGVTLRKLEPTRDKFVLVVGGQDFNPIKKDWIKPSLWETSLTNAANVVPLGTWMTIEIYFKEGSAGTKDGKFWVAVTPDEGTRQVICDYATGTERTYTQSPSDPAPSGMSELNVMKLYTSAGIINAIKAGPNPQSLQVYWDDYKLWKDRQPQ